jgi:hypothetical protein
MTLWRVGDTLIFLGLLAMAGAYAWWEHFYTQVARFLGAQGPLPLECLYQTSGPCSLVAAVAAWAGVSPYEPTLFWAGAFAFGAGLIITLMKLESQLTAREKRLARKPPEKIEPHL